MPTYKVISMVDGQPTFARPLSEILKELKPGGGFKVLSPGEVVSEQMRKWYRGILLPGLANWSKESENDWDMRLKANCGGVELLKKETIYLGPGSSCTRLSISGVGVKKMRQYVDNILHFCIEKEFPVTPPDSELRK